MSEFNEPILEQDVELLPDPERIVTGLRDTGYNFNTAIADIVDNSIAANATKVSILVNMTPEMDVTIYIADNGIGMNRDGLLNAMKYGSKERPEKSFAVLSTVQEVLPYSLLSQEITLPPYLSHKNCMP